MAGDRPASYDELIAELDRANPVRSRPTGLWPRLVAGLVDLILAALVAMPIGVFAENANIGLGLYFLVLAPLMLRRFGTTPGHALFETEVVPLHGERTTFFQGAVRYLTMCGPLMVGLVIDAWADLADAETLRWVAGATTVVGVAYPLLELARVALTTADARALWDRAAGTRVRYRLRGTGSLIPTGAPISRG